MNVAAIVDVWSGERLTRLRGDERGHRAEYVLGAASGSPPGDPAARSNDVAAPSADATRTSSGSP